MDGKPVRLEPSSRQSAVVFIFLSVDCPISNRYAPTLRKLQNEFQNVRWVLVYPNADESPASIKKNMSESELSCEAWRDTDHALVKLALVSVTPEAAVYLPAVGFIYRGRIDDRHVDFGKQRAEASTNELRDCLSEIKNGRIPASRATKAIGCSIPGIEK